LEQSIMTTHETLQSLSRRDFLKLGSAATATTATIAAALPTAIAAQPNTTARRAGGETPFVELAVATICTDGFGNRKHEPAFRLIPQLGIRNVEFNLWFSDVITPNYVASIKSRCAAAGLIPVCVQGTAFGGEGRVGVLKDVGHKLSLMYAARELGCRRVKCTGSGRGTQGGLKSVIEVCRELAPAARELDQLILVENHAKNVLEFISDYEELFAAVDSPHVGLCCDVAHFEGSGVSLHDVVEKFHSRLLHVDLKDNRTRGQGHDVVPFGKGITDFKAFLDHLFSKSYHGYLLIEMAWNEPKEPVLENLRKGRDLFQPYLRR
jgi:sugar phosphate isomerase/epimerase